MSKQIVLLCGERKSGKTKTLKTLVHVAFNDRRRTGITTINGKNVIVRWFGSPQELEEFCHFNEVIENIRERLNYCERRFDNNFVLVIPFSLVKKNGKTNENCIMKPIAWLKSRYSVHIIYLRKLNFADLMMRKVNYQEIESVENYSMQSNKLRNFIKKIV